ncbi:hypothetical protein QTN25_004100 [Entamoeba marina]
MDDRRLSEDKSKLLATKGAKTILGNLADLVIANPNATELVANVLYIYRGFLGHEQTPEGGARIDSTYLRTVIDQASKAINANPIPIQQWRSFIDDVEEYKKAKKEMRVQTREHRPEYYQSGKFIDRRPPKAPMEEVKQERQQNVIDVDDL